MEKDGKMADTEQVDIKKFLRIIARRQYLFISVSLSVLSVIVWGSFFIPEKYEAKSLFKHILMAVAH